MKRQNDWDTPILAVIKALDECAGQRMSMIEFRDWFQFHGGGAGSLQGALDIVERTMPGRFVFHYIRTPGSYTELEIEVFDRSDDADKK
jgi:hypothetical protein